jgi:predicted enzyme related to lactoylglutathione lyase
MNLGVTVGLYWQAMSQPVSNSVVHLELHTGDPRGAVDFYTKLFGWRPERIHAGHNSYLAMSMGDRVGGGIVECASDHPLWLPYVEVLDVEATTDRAQRLGGEVLLGPRGGPEGWRSVVSTPDGGEVAFWQPKTRADPRPARKSRTRRAGLPARGSGSR